jgi:hypothetical protein
MLWRLIAANPRAGLSCAGIPRANAPRYAAAVFSSSPDFDIMNTINKWAILLSRVFSLRASACILAITAALKFAALVELPKLWFVKDPLFPFISTGLLLATVAFMEIALAPVLFFGQRLKFGPKALLALCVLFALYRVGIYMEGHAEGCLCLGTLVALTDVFSSKYLSLALLVYLALSGSRACIAGQSMQVRVATVK